MNVADWKRKNAVHTAAARLAHPWPLYKKTGGIAAVVTRADGSVEDLGNVATIYVKRGWAVSAK